VTTGLELQESGVVVVLDARSHDRQRRLLELVTAASMNDKRTRHCRMAQHR
jgi:hypothetical protein